ncbi:MAG: hypothetical protein VYC40_01870 [Pseudomonadota bacterium]|nr:hypothetical protein [Pseudomonadota bacterium]
MKITKRDLREIIAEQLKEAAQVIDDIPRKGDDADMGYDPIADMLGVPQGDAEDYAAAERLRKGSTKLPSGQKAMSPEEIEAALRAQAEDLGIDPEVYMARFKLPPVEQSPPIKESNMKLTKQGLKDLIIEEMSSTGMMPDNYAPKVTSRMVLDKRVPTMDQIKDEVQMAHGRYQKTYGMDEKKAGFRLAADLTAIIRMFKKLNDASNNELSLDDVPGLKLLQRIYSDIVGGEMLPMGSFGAQPLDPAQDRQIGITVDDEIFDREDGSSVPVGKMRGVNESRRIAKQKLYRIIKEEMQNVFLEEAFSPEQLKMLKALEMKYPNRDTDPAQAAAYTAAHKKIRMMKPAPASKSPGVGPRAGMMEQSTEEDRRKMFQQMDQETQRMDQETQRMDRERQKRRQQRRQIPVDSPQDMFDKMDDKDFESGESEEGGVKTIRTKTRLGNWKLKALAVAANGAADGWDKHRAAFEETIAPENPEEKAMLLGLYQNKDIAGIQKWAIGR